MRIKINYMSLDGIQRLIEQNPNMDFEIHFERVVGKDVINTYLYIDAIAHIKTKKI